ncbi:MAG: CHAT domain-containing protein [Planctomycetes bacterium]|nr:CHAT domain-containing protein [Planctomycetota bacterium]
MRPAAGRRLPWGPTWPLAGLLLGLASAALPAQSHEADRATEPAWFLASGDVAPQVEQAIATLGPGRHGDYLRTVGAAFFACRPEHFDGRQRRACVTAHLGVVARAAAEPELVEWFLLAAASYQAQGGDSEGALATLAAVEDLAPEVRALRCERALLQADCLVDLQRLGDADLALARIASMPLAPEQELDLVARRGSLDVVLGRLDRAGRNLARADALAAGLFAGAPPPSEAWDLQFELQLRRLDLLAAREEFAAIDAAIDAFRRRCIHEGRELSAEQQRQLDLHAIGAAYCATQQDDAQVGPTIARITAAQAAPVPSARHARLLMLWLADLELRRGAFGPAETALQRLAAMPAMPRGNWLLAPIAAELARRRGATAVELAHHADLLRGVLREMIREWQMVSWEGESTGFLRLGSRLRVVSELLATTVLLDRQRAVEDLLELQCCTSASRARGVTGVSLAEVRREILPPGHGALLFVPAWNESHVFAIDADHVEHAPLPRAAQLRAEAGILQLELQALDVVGSQVPDLRDLTAASERVATLLLPAGVRRLAERWLHLTITGGNLLGGLAFGCLRWDAEQLLGERFALATSASLPLLVALRRADATATAAEAPSARLFATLEPSAAFRDRNRLETGGELDGGRWGRLLAALPAATERRVGAAATVGDWQRDASQHRRRLSVLLAHGELAVGDRPPALALAPDADHPEGLLTPVEVAASPHAGLVWLATCHGARGPARMGDDDVAASLAGAFLAAGATAVVASPAPLRASVHLDLAALAVAALCDGRPVAEALRQARVTAAAGDRLRAFLMGQVEVTGWGGHTLAEPPPQRSWLFLVGLGLLSLTAGCVARRRRSNLRSAPGSRRAAGAAAGP